MMGFLIYCNYSFLIVGRLAELAVDCGDNCVTVQNVYSAVTVVSSILGFILFCVLARWYKRRVRDDIATPHKWAEDAFDKYIKSEVESSLENWLPQTQQ